MDAARGVPNSSYPPFLYTIVDGKIQENDLDRKAESSKLLAFVKNKYDVLSAEIVYDAFGKNGFVARVEVKGMPPSESTYILRGYKIPMIFDRKGELLGRPIPEAGLF